MLHTALSIFSQRACRNFNYNSNSETYIQSYCYSNFYSYSYSSPAMPTHMPIAFPIWRVAYVCAKRNFPRFEGNATLTKLNWIAPSQVGCVCLSVSLLVCPSLRYVCLSLGPWVCAECENVCAGMCVCVCVWLRRQKCVNNQHWPPTGSHNQRHSYSQLQAGANQLTNCLLAKTGSSKGVWSDYYIWPRPSMSQHFRPHSSQHILKNIQLCGQTKE